MHNFPRVCQFFLMKKLITRKLQNVSNFFLDTHIFISVYFLFIYFIITVLFSLSPHYFINVKGETLVIVLLIKYIHTNLNIVVYTYDVLFVGIKFVHTIWYICIYTYVFTQLIG